MSQNETMGKPATEIDGGRSAHDAELMAHPFAATAAASAFGIGLAGHAFGMWIGAVAGAIQASQSLFSPIYDEAPGETDTLATKARSSEVKARSAARTLMESARSVAAGVAEAKPAKPLRELKSAAKCPPARVQAADDLLPEDFRRPKGAEKPATPDDLKVISGIGPKLEQVLNGLGVWTYAQVAGWSREEIAWVEDYLSFGGRIGRDDWIGQARSLVGQPPTRSGRG